MSNLPKIENKRLELQNIAKIKGLASSTTLRRSEELDDLLNTYQRKILSQQKRCLK